MIAVLPGRLLSLTKRKWRWDSNAILELEWDFNNIGVRSFIPTGAPIPFVDSIAELCVPKIRFDVDAGNGRGKLAA